MISRNTDGKALSSEGPEESEAHDRENLCIIENTLNWVKQIVGINMDVKELLEENTGEYLYMCE